MGKAIDDYFDYCYFLKKMLYNELIHSNYSKDKYIEYDSTDELAIEIFEPMFDSIIGISLNKNKDEIKKNILSLIDYYGFGSYNNVDNIAFKLKKKQSNLYRLFQKAKSEKIIESKSDNRKSKKLNDELDEYLRIGEELSKEKQK